MPLNKLDNFIKNTEGRILYVNPNDLDATDSISNQGNSLAQPFKTIQRALLEAARFSYLRGSGNDLVEKTTILLFPGEHVVDNRPGFAIKDVGGVAKAVDRNGAETNAIDTLSLLLTTNFDLTQSDNILYKFNSINGGVIVPRGTSIVGLDLRKTKIRPKYVPNPTDPLVDNSAIFRLTGACYLWQFSVFDGDEFGLVYTDPDDFGNANQASPTFSHHKLTVFEYADGVNIPQGYALTDLDMYYSKLSNAFNLASGRNIDQKYPALPLGFAKQRPEWEIVGAFASDPVPVASIISGDGTTASALVTVTTTEPHNLTAGTPIKVRGVGDSRFNISTKVQAIDANDPRVFTYLLPKFEVTLSVNPNVSGATVTIETDTVGGASPYVFNVSLRSVWGMNGMHADGSKASGFRSMVVAQFTAVSLQKDDRAFVKYNKQSRTYQGIGPITKVTGSDLSSGSSSTNSAQVYHLDPEAIYRNGWESTHIKMSNDAFVQIVSVFAIGFNKHFDSQSGGDGSITNSNSNFGQFSLAASGFKKEAFAKDDTSLITSIIGPKAISSQETDISWVSIDVGLTTSVGISSHLYLFGFTAEDDIPPNTVQGNRIGAARGDKIYVTIGSTEYSADIYMVDNIVSAGTTAFGVSSGEKSYRVLSGPTANVLNLGTHELQTGEKIRIYSDNGDLPENINPETVYYAIRETGSAIKIASSFTNASFGTGIDIYGGQLLRVVSRVSDKTPGELGSPVQWDSARSNWFLHVGTNSNIYTQLLSNGVLGIGARTELTNIKRRIDNRSLDERLYKVRVVIPKEYTNAKEPGDGFVIQDSSTVGARTNADFSLSTLTTSDFDYNRNPRFISTCSVSASEVTVISELPHNLKVSDIIIVQNVTDSSASGTEYNGTFRVTAVDGSNKFRYSTTDIFGVVRNPGTFTNNINTRNINLPTFSRNDLRSNLYVYRREIITQYIQGVQDGIYHLYVLNASNAITDEFTTSEYSQNVVDLYPQLDRDNPNDNAPAARTFAKRSPLGEVVTNDQKNSITRETADKLVVDFGVGKRIVAATNAVGVSTITFDREHGFNGITGFNALTGGTGHANGTYYGVKLFNSATQIDANWNGALATVTVSGGAVTAVQITSPGSGYANGNTLFFDISRIGGTADAFITITSAQLTRSIDNVVQITGIGTVTDGYYRIASVPSKTTISVAKTTGDPNVVPGQYVYVTGPGIGVSTIVYDSVTGIATITTTSSHGLLAGNRFRILNATNDNRGDFDVVERVGVSTFTALTNSPITGATSILRHGLSANNAVSDASNEAIGVRDSAFFDSETLTFRGFTSDTQLKVAIGSGFATNTITTRFPLGCYIQIGSEIMRVISSVLGGSGNNEITVIRGALGTVKRDHEINSLIRKIKPLSVEFRRPSIIRASGHTFEYLGYGPGNYSTGLPQVQIRTLSERESFLVQSQERSCGSIAYTGMNNDGDFFIGNTKYSSSSGTQTSFDIPIATITGQDATRNSGVFDEITVRDRLLVEGGASGTVLSQFDGPVTINSEFRVNANSFFNNQTKFNDTTQSTSKDTGSVIFEGGVGIEKDLHVGGTIFANIDGNVTNATEVSVSGAGDGNVEYYPTFVDGLGTKSLLIDDGIRYNARTNRLTTTNLVNTGIATFSNTANFSTEIRAFGLPGGSGGGQLRLLDSNYGVVHRTDSSAYYILLTNNGDRLGNFNALRPFAIDNATGNLSLAGARVNITHSNGNISTQGDITAFASDERLKTNREPIKGALEKVMSLSGFTYNFNDIGEKLGYDTSIKHVGVSAQEVQAVLPEAVAPAPADENYLTVKYEKIVPLLIEAIKELTEKVEALEQKINN
jgi:hypothetical protein